MNKNLKISFLDRTTSLERGVVDFSLRNIVAKRGKLFHLPFFGSLVEIVCNILNKDILSITHSHEFETDSRNFKEQPKNKNLEIKIKLWEELWQRNTKGEITSEDYKDNEIAMAIYKGIQDLDYKKILNFVDKVFVENIEFTTQERFFICKCTRDDACIPLIYSIQKCFHAELADSDLAGKFLLEFKKLEKLKEKNIFEKLLKEFEKDNCNVQCRYYYEMSTIEDLLLFFLERMILENICLKKCDCCGKYFYSKKQQSSNYCENLCPIDPTKTCKEYVSYQEYLKNNRSGSKKIYRQIYNILNNRRKRYEGGNKQIDKEIEIFKKDAKDWQLKIAENKETEDRYMTWLIEKKKLITQKGV
ncbi:MAG: hypothetical protein RUMPE_01320 [Eubacteriales bacterium SKADARSKE-1]|nr:hypothetical protein [Eubacteriales bacterium SKADARSKE-1]